MQVFGVDLRSLALWRILIAIVIEIDIFARLPDLRVFFTDEGNI
jgi:hypothetical protein